MQVFAVLGFVCTLAPLLFSSLCFFAGSGRWFLQQGELMTLNISRIGQTPLFDTNDANGDFLGDLTNAAKGDVNSLFGNLTSDVVEELGLPDFFTIYLRGYCSGMYSPSASAGHPVPRLMNCTNRSTMFSFSPTKMMEHALPHNITLSNLHWPSAIQDSERALQAFSTVLSLFYLLSLFSIGTAVLLAAWKTCFHGVLSALLIHGIDMFALFAITMTSIFSTVVIWKGVDLINTAGAVIGIAAQKGLLFLDLTWAATGCMLLATIVLFL